MEEIVDILDMYAVEDFDDVLIQIVNTFAEQRKERMEGKEDDWKQRKNYRRRKRVHANCKFYNGSDGHRFRKCEGLVAKSYSYRK